VKTREAKPESSWPIAPQVSSLDSSAQPKLETNIAGRQTPAAPRAAKLFQPQPEFQSQRQFQPPASARSTIGLARDPQGAASIGPSRGSATSASLPPEPIFAEPRAVANINNLSLDPHLAALTGSDALACERYRTLAVRVSATLARRKFKSLLVTSADEGEGKSSVAASLAWMMAKRDNQRTLFLDAGLRARPSSAALNLAASRGWLDLTDVSSQMGDALVRLDPNRLYVMTPYGENQNAEFDNRAIEEALASSRFEKMVAELAGYFDFIVIDGPAICRSVGAQQLASIADGTLIVARAGQTHHSRVKMAVNLAPQERRVGITLNESEVEADAASSKGANASIIKRLFGFGRQSK
jgi:Mrp family chromosome partitioning ATPase